MRETIDFTTRECRESLQRSRARRAEDRGHLIPRDIKVFEILGILITVAVVITFLVFLKVIT